MTTDPSSWLLFIVSLPSNSATARMRIWRALKMLGCAALRDGAYLLPHDLARQTQLAELRDDSVREGGSAWLLTVLPATDSERDALRKLFDRTADYADLLADMAVARKAIPTMKVQDLNRLVRKLRKELETLRARDFFPNDASAEAEHAWQDFFRATQVINAGEPQAGAGDIAQRDQADYRGRIWATRRRPWVDRVASAWLISRFIDPEATFLWLDSPDQCPPGALGFDFDGAAFTHVGEHVTFEVLLASFGLVGDQGLARLAKLVHALDVGGAFVAEASGFEAMLDGASERIDNDDELLANIGAVLDSLYAHYLKVDGT